MKNYYDILGISKNASYDDVKEAYKRLSSTPHEITNTDYDNMQKQAMYYEAYVMLVNKDKRIFYDAVVNENGGTAKISFTNQEYLDDFVHNVSTQLSHFYKENGRLESELDQSKVRCENKIEELESVINIISSKLAIEGAENHQSQYELKEVSQKYKEVEQELKRLELIEQDRDILRGQNAKLMAIARNHKMLRYKAVVSVSFCLAFIFMLIYINF